MSIVALAYTICYNTKMPNRSYIHYADLRQFIFQVLTVSGVPDHVAEIEAQICAEVDLCGVHSHGVRMLPGLVKQITTRQTNPDPKPTTVVELPASVLLEANRAIGRYMSAVGMDMAIERAEKFGLGAVAIRGVAHWGRGYSYGLRAANKGMIGLAFTNTVTNFPAWGTAEPSLGNNPMAIGVPSINDDEPVVLDIAMTQAAIGRVDQAAVDGQSVPLSWGLDPDGQPTTDPNQVIASQRFLPMGEYKGSGLSFMIELLTAGLADGLLCHQQGRNNQPTDSVGGSTKLFIAIRPYGGWLADRVESLKAHLQSVQPFPQQGTAQWPGEGSFQRRKDYLQGGIPLPDHIAVGVRKLSTELGIAVPLSRYQN